MPIYDYSCPECGVIRDVTAKICHEYLRCPECGRQMRRLFSPPVCQRTNDGCDLTPYLEENLGPKPIWIESRRQKRELLRRANTFIKNGGYSI